jgi:hypothetical protein
LGQKVSKYAQVTVDIQLEWNNIILKPAKPKALAVVVLNEKTPLKIRR